MAVPDMMRYLTVVALLVLELSTSTGPPTLISKNYMISYHKIDVFLIFVKKASNLVLFIGIVEPVHHDL